MNKIFELKKIFIFSGILSIILTPLAVGIKQEVYATSNCTNWAGLPDNDCDGLANAWEDAQKYTKIVNGIPRDVDLTGANKNHRDIFVEIDYMTYHRPTEAAIDQAVARFNAMEIVNPDTTTGIRLHYIIDDHIGHMQSLPYCNNLWDDYNLIKEWYMGTSTERQDSRSSDFFQAKRDVYRYALFIHTQCGNEQSSGKAELPGNDLVVSLGHPEWGGSPIIHDPTLGDHKTISDSYYTAAFMHELGHNLNLKHGGSADMPDCKPNYISVMNYLYEFDSNNPIDYSHSLIPALKETDLIEADGIGPAFSPWASTLVAYYGHYPPSPPTSHPSGGVHYWYDLTNDIPTGTSFNMYNNNWNKVDRVSSSINNFHSNGQILCGIGDTDRSNTAYGGKLFGYDDVHQDSLTFWGFSGTYGNGTGSPIAFSAGSPKQEALEVSPENKLKLQEALGATPGNFSISTNSTNTSTTTNETTKDILKNPTLAPCDITTVPGCVDSPCDKEDKLCKMDMGHNFTDLSLKTADYGNRTVDPREITSSEVLIKISSKVLNINDYLQSINASLFTNGSDVSKLKQDLQYSLVNATDSLYTLVNSSESDEALFKTLKLRSLVDGIDSSKQILQPPNNLPILTLVDDLIGSLQKRR